MQVFFHNFWSGFEDGTDPVNMSFFLELLGRVFENPDLRAASCVEDASVLVESVFGETTLLDAKSWAYTILVSGESSVGPRPEKYDCVLSGKSRAQGPSYVPMPLVIPYMACNGLYKHFRSLAPRTDVPSKLVCAVISNPNGAVRNTFLDRLEKRGIPVAHGGRFRRGACLGGLYNSSSVSDFVRQYKFVITMENSHDEYYLTEKITHGFVAQTIPIYWGSPHVSDVFNNGRYLVLESTYIPDMDALIKKMTTMTDSEWLSRVNSPIFSKDSDDIEELVRNIRSVLRLDNK